MKRFQCPTCGAPLDVKATGALLRCPYCSAAVVLPPELQATPAAPPPASATLLQDDLSADDGSWEMDDDSEGTQEHSPRGFHFRLGRDEWESYAYHGSISVEDASAEVAITKVGGPDDAWYGLLMRGGDEGCYCFCYSADGWYGIYGYHEESEEDYTIAEGNEAGLVHTGNASNVMRAVCRGARLELHLNGKQALWVKNTDFESGYLALAMGREEKDDGRVEAVFARLKVTTA